MTRRVLPWAMGFLIGGAVGVWAALSLATRPADEGLCLRLKQALDESALRDGRIRLAGDGVRSAEWQPVSLTGPAPATTICSLFEQTRLDLDHDGQQDLVIRARFCMKGKPSDSLYLFPADSDVLARLTWRDLAPLHETDEKFERTGGVYSVIPGPVGPERVELREVMTVELVVVNDRPLVALSAPPFEWVAVGTYEGRGAIENLCALRVSR